MVLNISVRYRHQKARKHFEICEMYSVPDSKIRWPHFGPTWILSAPRWVNVGPTCLAIWGYIEKVKDTILLSISRSICCKIKIQCYKKS